MPNYNFTVGILGEIVKRKFFLSVNKQLNTNSEVKKNILLYNYTINKINCLFNLTKIP